jgi:hypothetical protein
MSDEKLSAIQRVVAGPAVFVSPDWTPCRIVAENRMERRRFRARHKLSKFLVRLDWNHAGLRARSPGTCPPQMM